MKAEKKKMKKKKHKIDKGINKIAKADKLLKKGPAQPLPSFQIEIKGNRKEAFKANSFKLF